MPRTELLNFAENVDKHLNKLEDCQVNLQGKQPEIFTSACLVEQSMTMAAAIMFSQASTSKEDLKIYNRENYFKKGKAVCGASLVVVGECDKGDEGDTIIS